MRVSRVRSDSGYTPGRNLAAYRVLLDGVPQPGWVTADEERGMVERDVAIDDPSYLSGATEVCHGQVRVLRQVEGAMPASWVAEHVGQLGETERHAWLEGEWAK